MQRELLISDLASLLLLIDYANIHVNQY